MFFVYIYRRVNHSLLICSNISIHFQIFYFDPLSFYLITFLYIIPSFVIQFPFTTITFQFKQFPYIFITSIYFPYLCQNLSHWLPLGTQNITLVRQTIILNWRPYFSPDTNNKNKVIEMCFYFLCVVDAEPCFH